MAMATGTEYKGIEGVVEGNDDEEPTTGENIIKVEMFRCNRCLAIVPRNQKLALLHLKLSHNYNLKTRVFEGDETLVTDQPQQQITEVEANVNINVPPPAKKAKKTPPKPTIVDKTIPKNPLKNSSKKNITMDQMSPLIINVRSIKVHCNFCKAEFQDSSDLLNHVQQVHKLACSLKECNPLIVGGRPVVIQVKLPQESQPSTSKATSSATEVITLDSDPILPTTDNLKTNEVITLSDSDDDDDVKLEPINPVEPNVIPVVPIEPESNEVMVPAMEAEQEQ